MINIVKKIYIITGANGFLGNNIIRKLEQDADNEIRAFVLKGDSIKSLEGLKCKIYYGDVTKKETLSRFLSICSWKALNVRGKNFALLYVGKTIDKIFRSIIQNQIL